MNMKKIKLFFLTSHCSCGIINLTNEREVNKMLLLMANKHNPLRVNEEEILKDEGTCKNCKHQGDY